VPKSPAVSFLVMLILACAGGSRNLAAQSTPSTTVLRGTVEKIEGGRFVVDSAWVEPVHHARFTGRAHRLRQMQVGMWAMLQGRFDEDGVFQAEWIITRHLYPGHANEDLLVRQALGESARLEASGTLYANPEVQKYVDWIGMAVIPGWAKSRFDFRFRILSDPLPNAFALPDGSIFVTTGLLSASESDDQVAAVMGHEVAHVTEYHGARGLKRDQIIEFTRSVVQEILHEEEDREKGVPFLEIASEIGLDVAVQAALHGYDRAYEDQADRVGLRYAVEAGFDPRPAPGLWDLLTFRGGDHLAGRYFYTSRSSNRARRKNQEEEIRLHYGDPSRARTTRPAPPQEIQAARLALLRDDALLHFRAGRFDRAATGFSRILRLQPDDAAAHIYLGAIALDSSDRPERFDEAEGECRKAIQADPGYPDAHRLLGRVLLARGRNDEGRSELETYLRLAAADAPDREQVEGELGALTRGVATTSAQDR